MRIYRRIGDGISREVPGIDVYDPVILVYIEGSIPIISINRLRFKSCKCSHSISMLPDHHRVELAGQIIPDGDLQDAPHIAYRLRVSISDLFAYLDVQVFRLCIAGDIVEDGRDLTIDC